MIHLSLITPEKVVFSEDVDAVSLPTSTGEIQILEKHVPLVALLSAGELKIRAGSVVTSMAVSQGYIEVRPGNQVVVLANTAERATEIDVDRAAAARERARELMKGKIASEAEYASVLASIEKEWARVRIGHKHRTKNLPHTGN